MLSRLRNRTGLLALSIAGKFDRPQRRCNWVATFKYTLIWPDFWFLAIVPQKSKFFSWLSKQARARWRPHSITNASQHSPRRTLEAHHLDFSTEIPHAQRRILAKKPGFSTTIRHFNHDPHPSGQSDNAALVLWSWDERWARRVVTVLSLDFRF